MPRMRLLVARCSVRYTGRLATDHTLAVAVKLPQETDKPLPLPPTQIDEKTAIDRLNIRNDGSVSNDVAHHARHASVPSTAAHPLARGGPTHRSSFR